jgi:hypothetical protein
MIEAAAILSAVVHHWSDFVIIMVLLLANAIVGFWKEYQAGYAIAALKAKLAPHARVKRGGAWSDLAAKLLVPGAAAAFRNVSASRDLCRNVSGVWKWTVSLQNSRDWQGLTRPA